MIQDRIPIIILNWFGLEDTKECMTAVLNMEGQSYEVILVDNGSGEEEQRELVRLYSGEEDVTLVLNTENKGFTRGNSDIVEEIMAREVVPPYIALLNNDTVVDVDWIAALVRSAEENEADMISSKMINYYQRKRIDNMGHIMLNTGEILPLGHDDHIDNYTSIVENVGACGGAVLYRTEMIIRIGFFDPYFDTGYEDAEYGLRAKLSGHRCIGTPSAIVYHKGSKSINKIKDDAYLSRIQTNIFYTYVKLMPTRFLLVHVPIVILRYFLLVLLGVLLFQKSLIRIYGSSVIKYFREDLKKALVARRHFYGAEGFSKTYDNSLLSPTKLFLGTDKKRVSRRLFPVDYDDNKKKVVILAGPLDNQYAGVHIYTKELVNAINNKPNRKFDYTIVRLSRNKEGEFSNLKSHYSRTFNWLPGYETLRIFLAVPIKMRLMRADIVMEPAHFGPFNLPNRIKRVTMIHDITPILFPELHTFRGSFLHKLFLKRILKNADLILTNSNNTTNDVVAYQPSTGTKIERIYLGVGDEFYVEQDQSFIQRHSLEKPYFLVVGTIEPRKNHVLILKAFEKFKKLTGSDTLLVIVGKKGWKYEAFEAALSANNYKEDIRFMGYVQTSDLRKLYSHSTAMIYASSYEGFGLPVVEAGACGVNCVVSYNSSLRELAHKNVLYFNTIEELSLQLERVNDLPNDLGYRKNIAQYYQEKYSWVSYVNDFELILSKVVSSNDTQSNQKSYSKTNAG